MNKNLQRVLSMTITAIGPKNRWRVTIIHRIDGSGICPVTIDLPNFQDVLIAINRAVDTFGAEH